MCSRLTYLQHTRRTGLFWTLIHLLSHFLNTNHDKNLLLFTVLSKFILVWRFGSVSQNQTSHFILSPWTLRRCGDISQNTRRITGRIREYLLFQTRQAERHVNILWTKRSRVRRSDWLNTAWFRSFKVKKQVAYLILRIFLCISTHSIQYPSRRWYSQSFINFLLIVCPLLSAAATS